MSKKKAKKAKQAVDISPAAFDVVQTSLKEDGTEENGVLSTYPNIDAAYARRDELQTASFDLGYTMSQNRFGVVTR
jgi:hypothetical protein